MTEFLCPKATDYRRYAKYPCPEIRLGLCFNDCVECLRRKAQKNRVPVKSSKQRGVITDDK